MVLPTISPFNDIRLWSQYSSSATKCDGSDWKYQKLNESDKGNYIIERKS